MIWVDWVVYPKDVVCCPCAYKLVWLELFSVCYRMISPGPTRPKRPRKWTFQIETKKIWKSELLTLKNKKVRANLKNEYFFENFNLFFNTLDPTTMYTSDFDEKHDSDIDEMSHFLLLLKAFFMNSFFDIFFDTFFDTFFRQFEKPLKKVWLG